MENLSFDLIVSQGVFAVLFVWLLFDNKKETRERESKAQKREEKLQQVIFNNQKIMQEMAVKFDTVEDIKQDVKDIKIKLEKVGN